MDSTESALNSLPIDARQVLKGCVCSFGVYFSRLYKFSRTRTGNVLGSYNCLSRSVFKEIISLLSAPSVSQSKEVSFVNFESWTSRMLVANGEKRALPLLSRAEKGSSCVVFLISEICGRNYLFLGQQTELCTNVGGCFSGIIRGGCFCSGIGKQNN